MKRQREESTMAQVDEVLQAQLMSLCSNVGLNCTQEEVIEALVSSVRFHFLCCESEGIFDFREMT